MSKYKCVIFDCDGVLVDSEVIGNGVMVEMANELGAQIDLSYAMTHFKGSFLYSCMTRIESLIGQPLPSTFEKDYRQRSYEAFRTQIKPVKDVEQVLNSLRLPFCVASSGPVEKIKLNLSLTGLMDHFEKKVFSCYDIQKWKPDPAIFLWAAETMGFTPEECVVIEDSISGVNAALSGGFDVFGFTAHDHNEELKETSTRTFNAMDQLIDLLHES
ncbi:MAG: HAD-IA family hydrolase [Bacteroidia bacterium]|nr:HAD-IA family hydrolase [Bacteroidia bacterium]MBT8309950.1 HAD-IA family hydrolase [Bacteroidia bacterium]NND09771.1 HAD-IA family hydrolase [Flavobacteriaceae bacterium]NNK28358.1 HAD-IA family hydrolase [Flavobacteriaceae bacterium]NNL61980.1 HAD-IA family hydrolase [Flavobacteriaceae bacterium]